MVLNIKKWIENQITKQAKISHVDIPFAICDRSKIPSGIRSKIYDEYTEQFLLDANYILFFKSYEFSEKTIKDIFNMVNTSLGKSDIQGMSANNMVQSDFKLIKSDDKSDSDETSDANDEESTSIQPQKMQYLFLKITTK